MSGLALHFRACLRLMTDTKDLFQEHEALIWDGMRREETAPRYLPPIIPIVVHHSERG